MQTSPPPEAEDDLEFLFSISARKILSNADPQAFAAWFRESAPVIAGTVFPMAKGNEHASRAMLTAFAREIWNRTPIPENNFRPRPIAKPERNAPCHCGSGRKYKHCCLSTEDFGTAFPDISMLRYVLEQLPVKELADLPRSRLAPEELAQVAAEWMDKGAAARAAKLLEPLFADVGGLDERAEYAFDTLVECYNELGKPLKKRRLIERAMSAPDRVIRTAAMHRQCTVYADNREFDQAWTLFREAQRAMPDNPGLAHLEVLILLNQGERTQAEERAKFWIARLGRERDQDYSGLIAVLQGMIGKGGDVMLELAAQRVPALKAFAAAIGELPEQACHYALEPHEGSAGPLEPDAALGKLEREWRRMVASAKPSLTRLQSDSPIDWARADRLLAWLGKHSAAWNSFEVLDDWVLGLGALGELYPGYEERLVLPLLTRADALLRLAIETSRAGGLQLEWGFLQNRPALRLIVQLIRLREDAGEAPEAVRLLEWMVLTLNPNDNHGLREDLTRWYLKTERPRDALGVCDRYPDDFGAMSFDRVLALYRLNRRDEALSALQQARRDHAEMFKMLVRANPRRPRLQEGTVRVGGRDEAWYYREGHLDLWKECGALEWARTLSGRSRPRVA